MTDSEPAEGENFETEELSEQSPVSQVIALWHNRLPRNWDDQALVEVVEQLNGSLDNEEHTDEITRILDEIASEICNRLECSSETRHLRGYPAHNLLGDSLYSPRENKSAG